MALAGDTYCIFSANYFPSLGGVEKYTQSLASELTSEGHGVCIVTNNVFGLCNHEVLANDVEIVRLPCRPLFGGRLPIPRPDDSYRRLVHDLKARDWRGVLVNTRFYPHSLLGVDVAVACGVKPIVCDHGSAYLTFGNKVADVAVRGWEHAITAMIKHRDADFYAVSARSLEWLKTFGIEGKGVLSNSIDATRYRKSASAREFKSEFGVPAENLLVSFIGRFIPEKGVGVLLEAMKSLSDRPISLLMAGDGPLRNQIEEARLGNVKLVGRLDQPDVAALLQQSDLYCLPSRSEGFSTSLLEASACGTPALVTAVGGTDELIPDDSYGRVVRGSLNAGVLSGQLLLLENDREGLRQMGCRARDLVEKEYSWAQTAHAFVRACERANL